MPTWQFFHITTKVGRSSLTFLLPTTGHLPEPADYSVPTIDHIAGWLCCSMLFHVLPRFYGLVIAKKWAQKLAPSQSLLAAALLPPTTTVVVIIIHAAFHRWTVEVKRKAVPFFTTILFPSLLNDSSKVELRCDKVVFWFFRFPSFANREFHRMLK